MSKKGRYEYEGRPGLLAGLCFFFIGVFALLYFIMLDQTIKGNVTHTFLSDEPLSTSNAILLTSIIFGFLIFGCLWMGIRLCKKAKELKAKLQAEEDKWASRSGVGTHKSERNEQK